MNHVRLLKASTHWKDQAVGWHTWRGEVLCPICKKGSPATVTGTNDDAHNYTGPCDQCLKTN